MRGNQTDPSSVPERNFEDYLPKLLQLPFERQMEKYRRLKISEVVAGLGPLEQFRILDVGIGLHPVSRCLRGLPQSLVLVDPIESLIQEDQRRFPDSSCEYFNGTVENFPSAMVPDDGFNLVLLSSVLHEASDGSAMLQALKSIMSPEGILLVVVPNRFSIHRILGVHMGLLGSLEDRTVTENLMVQSPAYSQESLQELLDQSGFREFESVTHFFKPLTHQQFQTAIDSNQISPHDLDSYSRLGDLLDGFGAEIVSLAKRDGS